MNEGGNVVLIRYDGEMNSELCRGLILAVNNQLTFRESDPITRKRITQIITECLLNLNHHAEPNSKRSGHGKYVEVSVEETYEQYLIKTKNMVSKDKVSLLDSTLGRISSMNTLELKAHYETQLMAGQYTSKGTSGLG